MPLSICARLPESAWIEKGLVGGGGNFPETRDLLQHTCTTKINKKMADSYKILLQNLTPEIKYICTGLASNLMNLQSCTSSLETHELFLLLNQTQNEPALK